MYTNLHHIGIAAQDIEKSLAVSRALLRLEFEGQHEIED